MLKPRKPFVYIASPYTNGDRGVNVHFQCRIFDALIADDIVWPYMPLLLHFQHVVCPRSYEDWIEYDNAVIKQLGINACLRLGAEGVFSKRGPRLYSYLETQCFCADAEVELFKKLGRPVFFNKNSLYRWVEAVWNVGEKTEELVYGDSGENHEKPQ